MPEVTLPAAGAATNEELTGDLVLPEEASGLVVFAHGSGSSRHSSRNRAVAEQLRGAGLGTLLLDLLAPSEARLDEADGRYRFDIALLTRRVLGALDWLPGETATAGLPVGTFGASTGAAAALGAAARRPDMVRAVVSRGGRPDLTSEPLEEVRAPVLLIVGGRDETVIGMNRQAAEQLTAAPHSIEIVPGATHLFEEPGALEQVAGMAADWFRRNLG